MPIPVISNIQSVLGWLQWQPWSFQPYASYSPTSWTCSPLPPGVTFNTATGRIEGPSTMPGVYIFEVTAHNASGASLPKVFTLGIESAGFVQPSNAVEIYIDTVTRHVSMSPTFADVKEPTLVGKK